MELKALIFGKQCINKNVFHENKRPTSIDKVEIKRIVLSKKDSDVNETDAFSLPLCIKLP